MTTLRDDVLDEIASIYNNALRDGYVNDDDICDELGDYFDDVECSNDATLKQAYALARSAQEDDDALAKLKQAIDMLQA